VKSIQKLLAETSESAKIGRDLFSATCRPFQDGKMTTKCDDATPACEGSQHTQLQSEVARQLMHHGLRRVNVEIDEQRVVLTGTVHSYYLKQIAQETARRNCPERQVYNDVDVVQTVS
jgi:osmotically-inducible protein OsmY